MASIFKETAVAAPASRVWSAVRDVGAVTDLAPGFVTACELTDGGAARMITFANGLTVKEVIVGLDEPRRRVAYSATGGRSAHHNASIQVLDDGAGGARLVWTADVLPDEVATIVDGMMEAGLQAMKAAAQAKARV